MSPTIVCSTAEAMPRPASGVDAEMADQRGVDDEEERLGDERAERGHGEPQDVAVQRRRGARHPPSLGSHRGLDRPPPHGFAAPAGSCEAGRLRTHILNA